MKKLNARILILSVIVCLLPMIAGVIFYGRLPLQIAIHWDINNEPDNYVHKALALFIVPALFACIQAFFCASLWQASKKTSGTPKVITVSLWILPLVSVMAYTLMLLWAFGHSLDIDTIGSMVVSIVFILIGNYLPKISYNDGEFVLSYPKFKSEKSFRRFMRIFGIVFFLAGIALFVFALL